MSSESNTNPPYVTLSQQVGQLFAQHGDTHEGLGYPKPDGYAKRQEVLLDVMRFGPSAPKPARILELGCATGVLLDHLEGSAMPPVEYLGVDLLESMVQRAREKHPLREFVIADPLRSPAIWTPQPDYVIMGGLFTWRSSMTAQEMRDYMLSLVTLSFQNCKVGISFNVMSKHVDWEREDLFHVPFDEMASILTEHLGRNYIFRADYGLYEYMTYVYR
jgi:SAM-dependent methyltransferase